MQSFPQVFHRLRACIALPPGVGSSLTHTLCVGTVIYQKEGTTLPRTPRDTDHITDTMDDESYENWETVSEGFGTKIEWNVGVRFIGVFTGTRMVPVQKDAESGNPLDEAEAAEFTKDGEKFYCWLPYQLKEVITEGKLTAGQTVYIECTGEEETKRGLNKVKTFVIKVKP